jgi:hypothetical protein
MVQVPCGGKCGDPKCAYRGKDEAAVKSHASGKKGRAAQIAAKAAPKVAPGFYPHLKDFKPLGTSPAPGAAFPGAPVVAPLPVVPMSTAKLWKGMADIMDEYLLKDRKVKIAMSEAESKALDESLKLTGFAVSPPPGPIVVPYWFPFAVTAISVFAPPLVALAIEYLKGAAEDRKERRKTVAVAPLAAAVVSTSTFIPAPPSVPPAQPFHDPERHA